MGEGGRGGLSPRKRQVIMPRAVKTQGAKLRELLAERLRGHKLHAGALAPRVFHHAVRGGRGGKRG